MVDCKSTCLMFMGVLRGGGEKSAKLGARIQHVDAEAPYRSRSRCQRARRLSRGQMLDQDGCADAHQHDSTDDFCAPAGD